MTTASPVRPRLGAITALALGLAACAEGRAPETVRVEEERYTVWRLASLTEATSELHIAAEQGLVLDFGRAEAIAPCDTRGWVCIEHPFFFAMPTTGEVPERPWTVGEREFRVLAREQREFCGRRREVYLIEGSAGVGWASRVWYSPDFGVYAVTNGYAEGTAMDTVLQAWATCDRGLYDRDFLIGDRPR